MKKRSDSNAEVPDILFAVALGEGFMWRVQKYRGALTDGTLFNGAGPDDHADCALHVKPLQKD